MELSPGARDRIASKYRKTKKIDSDVVEQIAADVLRAVGPTQTRPSPSPFAVSWMDSYLAHWELRDELAPRGQSADDVAVLVRQLIDVRFDERLAEIRDFIRNRASVEPDGGPPEPGTPPTGPSIVFEPPDGGPPEPGTPPTGPSIVFEPPDGGPPEPGTPPTGPSIVFEPPDGGPPEPGTPPTGPDVGLLGENPWILYWFVSVKAPMLLDVIDAHLTRRLNELAIETR